MPRDYNHTVNNILIAGGNCYNSCFFKNLHESILVTTFSTFHSERSLRFIRLYNLLFTLSGQRPILKRFILRQVRKRGLKLFSVTVRLNNRSFQNFVLYLREFYSYFFHIFYQKRLVGGSDQLRLKYCFDNSQQFIKNYGKHSQRTRINYFVRFRGGNGNLPLKYTLNMFLSKLRIREKKHK